MPAFQMSSQRRFDKMIYKSTSRIIWRCGVGTFLYFYTLLHADVGGNGKPKANLHLIQFSNACSYGADLNFDSFTDLPMVGTLHTSELHWRGITQKTLALHSSICSSITMMIFLQYLTAFRTAPWKPGIMITNAQWMD